MSAVIEAPMTLIEALAEFRFPPKMDARAQVLMDRSTEGQLTEAEREELESLAYRRR
jgi:hypothetical protein